MNTVNETTKVVNVLGILRAEIATRNDAAIAFNAAHDYVSGEMHAEDRDSLKDARVAVAGLISSASRVIRAFEALGNATGIVPENRAHRECENAMVELKDSLLIAGGIA